MSGSSRPPGAPLAPTRTLAAEYEFDEQTEIVREAPDEEDEYTLRGNMLVDAPPSGFTADPDPTRIPPAPAPASRIDPRVLILGVAAIGGGLGVLAAVVFG